MPSNSSRFVHSQGLVRFLTGNTWGSRGSRISPSSSVRLLEYGMVCWIWLWLTLVQHFQRCQMGSIYSKKFGDYFYFPRVTKEGYFQGFSPLNHFDYLVPIAHNPYSSPLSDLAALQPLPKNQYLQRKYPELKSNLLHEP